MSLERDKARLENYYAAEESILAGDRNTELKGMKYQEAALADIRRGIADLENKLGSSFRVSRVVFEDRS
ncbi:hypothetical protein [Maridesulfovibrio ferrireducens]|uniref:hypothetical protein n=1 Tax=Maridesulfovibrio ferrireducens TaxID=246191 RepID=UPI001A33F560|nr:hypothetical protein [Maridesulfovibrio ferrireducens]MBI9109992.1 hypothetical protein [Maridesulfovibrio ferrireducens]